MRKTGLTALAIIGIAAISSAQSLNDYFALRKKHNIRKTTSFTEAEAAIGSNVIELKCVVKGLMRTSDRGSIYTEDKFGNVINIDVTSVPDWLQAGDVPARLIVRFTKDSEYANPHVELLGAAPESKVAAYEKSMAPPPKSAGKTTSPSTGTSANVFNQPQTVEMYGPIGGSRSSRRTKSSASRGSAAARTATNVKPASEVVPIYAGFIKNHNKKLTDRQAFEIANAVIRFSLHYDVDARLVIALLIAESDFDPRCTSHVGARGLGQLMPETARELGVVNAYDLTENLYGTIKLLRQNLDRYGSRESSTEQIALALAAYNAGPGAVKKFGGIPPYRETQNYVRKVLSLYNRLRGDD